MDVKVRDCDIESDFSMFCYRLKSIREASELTQSDFADLLGVSRGAISYYERGDRKPDIEFIFKICRIFELPVEYVMGSSYEVNPDYSKLNLVVGLSSKASHILEADDFLGMFISSILEHKDFKKLCSFADKMFLDSYKKNPKSSLYCEGYVGSDPQYLSYLFTTMLHKIISDVVSEEFLCSLSTGYTTEDATSFFDDHNKAYTEYTDIDNIPTEKTTLVSKECQKQADEYHASDLFKLREKVHAALEDFGYAVK